MFVLTDERGGGVWSLEVHVCFCSCDHGIPPPMMVMQAQNKFNFVVVTMVSGHRPAAACMMMLSVVDANRDRRFKCDGGNRLGRMAGKQLLWM